MSIGKINLIEGSKPNFEAMPIVGVTSEASSIARTQSVVGTFKVQGPGANVTANVRFKKDRDGNIRFHTDRNGNKYTWADIILTEEPTIVTQRVIKSQIVDAKSVDIELVDGKYVPVKNEHGWINHNIAHVEEMELERTYQLLEESDKITKGNVQLTPTLVLDGYRVTVYEKDTGVEITASAPSKKGKYGGWVNKFTGYIGWMAKRLVPAVEYAFILDSNVVPGARPFSATCSQCANCYAKVYGQNQEEPAVGCSLGLREELDFGFHWEQEDLYRQGLVSLGSGIYFMHSEAVDDITCLPSSKWHMSSATASNRGRVGYEIPSWFSSTNKANEVILDLYKALYLDLKNLFGDSALAGLRTMWMDETTKYDIELPGKLFDEEDESVELEFLRFEGSKVTAPNPDKDVLPSWDRIMELTANLNPMVARFMLEGSVDRETAEMFPNMRAMLQEHILAEPNPRMIKAADTSGYMKEKFDEPGCLWFSYSGSRKQAYGSATFNARTELGLI